MPKTEGDPLGPGFVWRLRMVLDRVEPRFSTPRYLDPHPVRSWRLAPKALMVGVTGVLVLTLFAASSKSTPGDIEHRILTTIQANQAPTPPEDNPSPPAKAAPPVAVNHPAAPKETAQPRPEPSDHAEAPYSPRPAATPTPDGESHSTPSPSPSPSGDH